MDDGHPAHATGVGQIDQRVHVEVAPPARTQPVCALGHEQIDPAREA